MYDSRLTAHQERGQALLCAARCVAIIAALLPAFASAQSTGRVYYGYAGGGVGDAMARLLVEALREETQQPFVMEIRAGGQGKIAIDAVKAAMPDGNTLLFTPIANICILPHTQKNIGYDPLRDFTPVSMAGGFAQVLAVGPATPARSVAEFVTWAKANPKLASFGTPGNGNLPHFFGLLLARATGIELINVPYKGSAPAAIDLMGGQIPAAISGLGDFIAHARAEKVRILGIASAERSSLAPMVPTFRELGFPELDGRGWYGLFAPTGTNPNVVERINRIVTKAQEKPAVRERMQSLSLEVRLTTPTQFSEIIRVDHDRWGQVIRAAGFTAAN